MMKFAFSAVVQHHKPTASALSHQEPGSVILYEGFVAQSQSAELVASRHE